jgi:hypothetical protein
MPGTGETRYKRRPIVALALGVVLISGLSALLASSAGAAAVRLEDFDHKSMVQAGMPCLFCHTAATRSPAAGMPSLEQCMGCHRVIKKDSPEIVQLAAYWEAGQPISWPRLSQVPRFVYFSHQVHVVSAALNCERCHGDVGNMGLARPVVRMDMGWCLECHSRDPDAEELRDCVTCHR